MLNLLRRKRGTFSFSIIAVSSILNCRIGFAQQDQYSANFIMTGCREAASLIAFSNPSNEHSELAQFCLGIIVGLTYQAQSDGTICVPVGLTREQAVRAVVQYIDGQPARINENFVPLATEALQATWPCKHSSKREDAMKNAEAVGLALSAPSFPWVHSRLPSNASAKPDDA